MGLPKPTGHEPVNQFARPLPDCIEPVMEGDHNSMTRRIAKARQEDANTRGIGERNRLIRKGLIHGNINTTDSLQPGYSQERACDDCRGTGQLFPQPNSAKLLCRDCSSPKAVNDLVRAIPDDEA
jgi:hypothetical protein